MTYFAKAVCPLRTRKVEINFSKTKKNILHWHNKPIDFRCTIHWIHSLNALALNNLPVQFELQKFSVSIFIYSFNFILILNDRVLILHCFLPIDFDFSFNIYEYWVSRCNQFNVSFFFFVEFFRLKEVCELWRVWN